MNSITRAVLLASTAMAVSLALQAPAAQAQPVSGLYVGAGAGVNFLGHQNHSASTDTFLVSDYYDYLGSAKVNATARTESRPGFVGLASIGWGFGNGLRAEIEGSWRSNRVRGTGGSGSLNWDGDRYGFESHGGYARGRSEKYAAMVNVLFDMNIGASWVYPYIGAGAGYAWQRFSGHAADEGGGLLGGEGYGRALWQSNNATAGRFAYQGIAGAAFPIAGVPGLSLTAEYRFMGTLGSRSQGANGIGGFSGCCSGNGGFSGEGAVRSSQISAPYNHSVLLGVRYAFNAAPAAVMAAPAAVALAGKSFLVFFDWDKSTLTDRARGIIKEAAMTSKSTAHTVVEVKGYADTSGNPNYNQGISMRRAQTVAAELVRNGVAKGEIAIKAFGDTVLLVPTGPGVREPQNRRVEIVIR